MVLILVVYVSCWTPATVMIVMQFFRLPYHDHPLVDIVGALFATMSALTSPILNLVRGAAWIINISTAPSTTTYPPDSSALQPPPPPPPPPSPPLHHRPRRHCD